MIALPRSCFSGGKWQKHLFRCWFAKQLTGREREQDIAGILRVKLAMKLLVIAWSLMKNKEMFAGEKLNYS
jgi:transposase